ncbi:MAG: phasin family protein [Gammaproteobacteria bacterium]
MQQPSIEQTNEFCSQAYAVMKDYRQINTRFWTKYTEQQLDFLQLCTKYGQRELELWTNGKDLPGLIGAQSSLAMEFNKECADQFRALLACLTEARAEAMRTFDSFEGHWPPATAAEEDAKPTVQSPAGKRARAA